jgi:Ni/Fe-hydrogenase subunit HybB-like protein
LYGICLSNTKSSSYSNLFLVATGYKQLLASSEDVTHPVRGALGCYSPIAVEMTVEITVVAVVAVIAVTTVKVAVEGSVDIAVDIAVEMTVRKPLN